MRGNNNINQHIMLSKARALLIAVAIFMVLLASFLTQKPVNAEGEPSASATMDVETMVQESISVGIDSNGLAFSVTPTSGGTFSAQSLNVHVYTNAKGYKLYISNKTAETALKHTDSSISTGIPTLTTTPSSLSDLGTGGIARDAFPTNSWGFSLNGNNYFGVSYTNPTLIKDTDNYTDIGDSVTQIYFGTKVDTALPAGTYQNTVLITASATEVPPLAPGIGGTTNPSDPGDHNGWTEGTEVSVTETGTSSFGVDHYEYYIMNQDGSQATPFSMRSVPSKPDFDAEAMGVGETVSITSDHYADGIYYVFFRTVDKNGRKSDWSDGIEVKLDTTAPAVTYLARTGYNTFDFTVTDNMSLAAYCVNTSDSAEGCSWQSFDSETEGTTSSSTGITQLAANFTISASANNWHVWAKDSFGHINELANGKSIESFKVSRSATNATLTTKYEYATGTAFENETYVLKDTPIYVEIGSVSGYGTPVLTLNDETITSGTTHNIVAETNISAIAMDSEAPTNIELTRTSYNTFTVSASDNITSANDIEYYVGTDSNGPTTGTQNDYTWAAVSTAYTTNTTSEAIYYVWVRDKAGNIAGGNTAASKIATYLVTRSQGTNTTLTTYRDAVVNGSSCDSNISGTALTDLAFTSNMAVLSGTPVCTSAAAGSGYNLSTFKWGSTDILSGAGGYSANITGAVTISTGDAMAATMSSNATYMQRISKDACNNTATNTATVLYDERVEADGDVTLSGQNHKGYLVGKLADGHCWMLQNLAVGNNSDTYALSTTYSNKAYTMNKGTTAGFNDYTSGHLYIGSHTTPTTTATTIASAPTMDSASNTGGYYAWCTATAGTACSNTSYASDGADVNSGLTENYNDICPRGWRLPTKAELITLCNGNSTYGPLFKIGLVGYYTNGSLNYSGHSVYWRTSTAGYGSGTYVLDAFSTSSFNRVYNDTAPNFGFVVRCVL